MIIISDCLTDHADEGTIKIASKLSKMLKKQGAHIIQLNSSSSFSDKELTVGKSGISSDLLKEIKKKQGNILYIPNASMTKFVCVRVFLLSVFTGKKVFLLPVYRRPMNTIMKLLLRLSKTELVVLSNDSKKAYSQQLKNKVHYIKAGVDTEQFVPVDAATVNKLRDKYGFHEEDIIALHVGHMVEARNLRKLKSIDSKIRVVIVVSTSTRWDEDLYEDLKCMSNVTIIHEYLEHIEELYQMADVYIFPVEKVGCVDVPLSVLEAASCDKAVVCTRYGELNTIEESNRFVFIDDFSQLNQYIQKTLSSTEDNNRSKIEMYSWKNAVESILKILGA